MSVRCQKNKKNKKQIITKIDRGHCDGKEQEEGKHDQLWSQVDELLPSQRTLLLPSPGRIPPSSHHLYDIWVRQTAPSIWANSAKKSANYFQHCHCHDVRHEKHEGCFKMKYKNVQFLEIRWFRFTQENPECRPNISLKSPTRELKYVRTFHFSDSFSFTYLLFSLNFNFVHFPAIKISDVRRGVGDSTVALSTWTIRFFRRCS